MHAPYLIVLLETYLILLCILSRYWLEQAENVFPQNKTIKRLREKIKSANEGIAFEDIHPDDVDKEELNGNGGHGDSDDNSAFW